jgi:GNAT superfamily N-acetyltransferase
MRPEREITIRTDFRPGDLGAVVHLHGTIYGRERGWDATFEAYVAGPLSKFVLRADPGERLWIAENGDQIVGCVAIVAARPQTAQLRWFLVDPATRGAGLGRRLLREAVAFCRAAGYSRIALWTERSLTAAAHLYRAEGFRLVREKPGRRWGAEVVEERYELKLSEPPRAPNTDQSRSHAAPRLRLGHDNQPRDPL